MREEPLPPRRQERQDAPRGSDLSDVMPSHCADIGLFARLGALGVLAVAVLFLIAGCSSVAPNLPDLAKDPDLLALAKAGPPLVFTVAVAPPIVGEGGREGLAPSATGAERAVSPRRV